MPTGDFTKELNNLTRLNNKETLRFDFGNTLVTQGFYCQLMALKCHFSSNTKSNVTHLQYVREGVPPSLSSNSRKHRFMQEKWCLQ